MNKIWLVARREYLATVRRKAFIIMTVGLPIFFALMFGISGAVGLLAVRSEAKSSLPVGIVDEAHVINLQLLDKVRASYRGTEAPAVPGLSGRASPSVLEDLKDPDNISVMRSMIALRSYPSVQEARSAFLRKEIRGYYIFPADFIQTGRVTLESRKASLMSNDRPAWGTIQRLVQASLLDGKVDDAVARRVWVPPQLNARFLSETGEPAGAGRSAEFAGFAVPYFFTLFFMMSVIGTSGYLLQGVAEEKENRVIEILVSSATMDQLLAGKVLGLCGAGLTQLLAWTCLGVAPLAYALPFLDLRWSQAVVALVFFLLGFLMFGTLMAGCGALGNNYKESQQLSIVWTMSAVSPLFVLPILLQQPNGTLARVFSYVPLTAPVTMMLRISATRVPLWDIALSALILAGSLFFFVRLGGKLFRLGILMYGKRPSLVEIVRWLKVA